MLTRRITSSVVFLPFFILCLIHDSGIPVFCFLGMGCSVWGLLEYYKLAKRIGANPPVRILCTFAVLSFPVLWLAVISDPCWFYLWFLAGLLVALCVYLKTGQLEGTWESTLTTFFSLFYILIPLLMLFYFRLAVDQGSWLIFYLFLVTWLSDSGAYFGGRWLGRNKLSPVISPNKTWEGLFAGLLLAVIGVLLAGWLQYSICSGWGNDYPTLFWTTWNLRQVLSISLLSIFLVLTGTLGDLFESMLKRDIGVKDSGSDLTGHGGFLDIMDSLLVNIPILFGYVLFLK